MNLRKYIFKIGLIWVIAGLITGFSIRSGFCEWGIITDIALQPPTPTNKDSIEIIVSGSWGIPCFEITSSVNYYGTTIRIDVAVDQLSVICIQVVAPWEITESIGTMEADTYNIEVYLNNRLDYSSTVFSVVKSIEDFVTRFYELCLARSPDPDGLKYWVEGLSDGSLTVCDLAYGFMYSEEFSNKETDDEGYLRVLYETFLDRPPDPAGLQGWLDAIKKGASRVDVLDGFIFADEFAQLCDEYGIKVCDKEDKDPKTDPVEDFVTRFYRLCLDRDPDPAGLTGWTNDLLNHIRAGADIARGFIYSQEFINKNTTNEEYLTILYKAFFNREPDQAGWDVWLAELNKGKERGDVLDGFLYSGEFYKLCEDFGITPVLGFDYVPGEVIVGFAENLSEDQARLLLESLGLNDFELSFSEQFSFWLYITKEDSSNYVEILESNELVKWADSRGMSGNETYYSTILVHFKPKTTVDEARRLIGSIPGLEIARENSPAPSWGVVKVEIGTELTWISTLSVVDGIRYAELNHLFDSFSVKSLQSRLLLVKSI